MKRKPKLSRIAQEAAAELHRKHHISTLERTRAYLEGREPVPDLPGYDPNYKGMAGPGNMSSDAFSWIEEQNAINHAIAQQLKRGGRKDEARDRRIWQEFKERRPNSRKSDTALTIEIGRKYGLGRSAAIEARERGKKSSG
jgi:hypothetical protein